MKGIYLELLSSEPSAAWWEFQEDGMEGGHHLGSIRSCRTTWPQLGTCYLDLGDRGSRLHSGFFFSQPDGSALNNFFSFLFSRCTLSWLFWWCVFVYCRHGKQKRNRRPKLIICHLCGTPWKTKSISSWTVCDCTALYSCLSLIKETLEWKKGIRILHTVLLLGYCLVYNWGVYHACAFLFGRLVQTFGSLYLFA